ncbi:hypothetical protein [Cypionkella sinensis]|uniref:Arsenical-resistance protein n=1 Tax=Cypionkella sinensis TaxID=1756043 RepID=A0ABV7IZ20_9RHOB
MTPEGKHHPGTLPDQDAMPPDVPVESGKQILINWIIVVLGLGGVAAMGALLPELL